MKFISFNYKGLVNPSKKSSFKHLVQSVELDLIFLQETLGDWEVVKASLKGLLRGRLFETTIARVRFGVLALGCVTPRF